MLLRGPRHQWIPDPPLGEAGVGSVASTSGSPGVQSREQPKAATVPDRAGCGPGHLELQLTGTAASGKPGLDPRAQFGLLQGLTRANAPTRGTCTWPVRRRSRAQDGGRGESGGQSFELGKGGNIPQPQICSRRVRLVEITSPPAESPSHADSVEQHSKGSRDAACRPQQHSAPSSLCLFPSFLFLF